MGDDKKKKTADDRKKKESGDDKKKKTDKTKKEDGDTDGSSLYPSFFFPVPPGKGQKPFDEKKPEQKKKLNKANIILGVMKSHQPFHEMDRWHALADAGLTADYWIEEVVDDDVETPAVRTVSYG